METPKLEVPLLEFIRDSIAAKYDLAMAEARRVDAMVLAQDRAAQAAQAASALAITKAEAAQRDYNLAHNDLLRKIDTLTRELQSKEQADAEHRAIESKIERAMSDIKELRESRREGEGRSEGVAGSRSEQTRRLTLLISLGFLALAVLQLVLNFYRPGAHP